MSFRASLVALAAVCLVSLGCSSAPSGEGESESDGEEITRGAKTCSVDTDCSHGVEGLGVICVRSGPNAGTCGDGCHSDADCPGGGSCDKSTAHWMCDDPLPKIGTPCAEDTFCNGKDTEGDDDTENLGGTGRVCSSRTKRCIVGCHSDDDCPTGARCDTNRTTFVCVQGGNAPADDNGTDDPPGTPPSDPTACPAITYPSGVTIVTKASDAMSAKYKALAATSCAVPKCFLDLDDLRAPDGTSYDVDVQLSTHFTLREIVHTEIDGSWSKLVLVDRAFVEKLEQTRERAGVEISLSSGFRSPDHQRATCMSLCGCAQCVSDGRGGNRCGNGGGRVTCAKNSRHMWGAAADLGLGYSTAARASGFPFVFEEYGGSGPHLHVDMKSCR